MLSEIQIQDLIDTNEDISKRYFVWQMQSETSDGLTEFLHTIMDQLDHKVVALMINQDTTYDDAESNITSEYYLVLTDDEADVKAEERANERLADDLHEVPNHLHIYFDSDAYISDQISDRGALLDMWSSSEDYEKVEGETYYIYRQ